MISAQNRHLLSSGNNPIAYFCLLLLLSSCGGSKKTTSDANVIKPKVKDHTPKSNQYSTMDTVKWTEIDLTKKYNETIDDLDLDKRSQYQIALLYPFDLDGNKKSDALNPSSRLGRTTQYYAGTLMALEQLKQEDISLEVLTIDAEVGSFDRILQQCKNADVIIGPKDKGQLATTAHFGRNNQIPIVSPWLSSTKVTKDNPFYIQLKPSLKGHMHRIVEHVKDNYNDDQVYVLGRKNRKDIGMMKYIQSVANAMTEGDKSKPFQEYFIEEDSLLNAETAYEGIIAEDKTTVFILPNWSFVDDEQFVYNAVRKLSGEKGLNNVVLYGMPILLESPKIGFDLYSNLNMRICRTSYLDRQSEAVREFKADYFLEFGDFPSEEAFKGFDMMMFIGRGLKNYGKKFQYFIDTYESSLYQTEFEVTKVFDPKSGDKLDNIQYFQNEHLYILEFKDNKFHLN